MNSEAASDEYRAASTEAAFVPRQDRGVVRVAGKAPGEMLKGILTSRLPHALVISSGQEKTEGVQRWSGEVVYSAILTPKGKMLTDARVFRGFQGEFLLDLPGFAKEATLAHLRRFLPPRFASAEDVSADWTLLTLLGPRGASILARLVGGAGVGSGTDRSLGEEILGLAEGLEMVLPSSSFGPVRIAGNGDVRTLAWDVIVACAGFEAFAAAVAAEGAQPITPETLEILRVEGGRPAFGVDMGPDTIPIEAGIHHRAIDYGKGCYTGQEVIIRIRDRGHVNKSLRGLLLGDAPVPRRGDELFAGGADQPVGRITSACRSPAFGQTVALGYVATRLEPGAEVRVGGPGGPAAEIRDLDGEGWDPDR